MLYDFKCWVVKKQYIQKNYGAKMRMLIWKCGVTKKDMKKIFLFVNN